MAITRSSRLFYFFGLLLVAFLLRLAAVYSLRDIHAGPTLQLGDDPVEYEQLARQLAEGRPYELSPAQPTSFRAPGFPLALAGLYYIVGPKPMFAYLYFCLLGAASCVLTYLLARELLSEAWAMAAGALAAVYVPNIYLATTFLSENVFIPALALGVYLIIRHLKTASVWTLASGGLLLGYCTLTRANALLFLPVMMAILIGSQLYKRKWQPFALVVFAAAFLSVILPWTVRNYLVHGRFVPVSTLGGSTFYGGNNSRVLNERQYMGYWVLEELPGRERIREMSEVDRDRLEWNLGKQWVREHLGSMPKLLALKFVRMWLPNIASGNKRYVLIQVVGYTPFLVLYLLAAFRCVSDRQYWTPPWLVMHGVLLTAVITTLIFFGCPRYRDSHMPILMLYAVVGLGWIIGRLSHRHPQWLVVGNRRSTQMPIGHIS